MESQEYSEQPDRKPGFFRFLGQRALEILLGTEKNLGSIDKLIGPASGNFEVFCRHCLIYGYSDDGITDMDSKNVYVDLYNNHSRAYFLCKNEDHTDDHLDDFEEDEDKWLIDDAQSHPIVEMDLNEAQLHWLLFDKRSKAKTLPFVPGELDNFGDIKSYLYTDIVHPRLMDRTAIHIILEQRKSI